MFSAIFTNTRLGLMICATSMASLAYADVPTTDAGQYLTLSDIAVVEKSSYVAGQGAPARSIPQGGRRIGGWAKLNRFLSANPSINTCADLAAAYHDSGLPPFSGLETIRWLDGTIKAQMSYRNEYDDRWTNLSKAILAGKHVDGDCDDMALTAAALAICSGAPAQSIGIAIYNGSTFGKVAPNHMVATYTDPNGRVFVFGDTNGPIWNTSVHQMDPAITASLADFSVWREH